MSEARDKIILWRRIKADIRNCLNHGEVWGKVNVWVKKGEITIKEAGKIVVWWHNAKIKGILIADDNIIAEDIINELGGEEID